jgi:DDE domain
VPGATYVLIHGSGDAGWYWHLVAARLRARPVGTRWRCDETYVRVGERWAYLNRTTDEGGQVVDVLLREQRDLGSARAFLDQAIARRGGRPRVAITDKHAAYRRAVRRRTWRAAHIRTGFAPSPRRDDESDRTVACAHQGPTSSHAGGGRARRTELAPSAISVRPRRHHASGRDARSRASTAPQSQHDAPGRGCVWCVSCVVSGPVAPRWHPDRRRRRIPPPGMARFLSGGVVPREGLEPSPHRLEGGWPSQVRAAPYSGRGDAGDAGDAQNGLLRTPGWPTGWPTARAAVGGQKRGAPKDRPLALPGGAPSAASGVRAEGLDPPIAVWDCRPCPAAHGRRRSGCDRAAAAPRVALLPRGQTSDRGAAPGSRQQRGAGGWPTRLGGHAPGAPLLEDRVRCTPRLRAPITDRRTGAPLSGAGGPGPIFERRSQSSR